MALGLESATTDGLLHLGDLILTGPLPLDEIPDPNSYTIKRRLNADDAAVLQTLRPEEVQNWCLSRITEYQSRNRALLERRGSVYNPSIHAAMVRHRSNMCALRAAYNDAAPVHRLPPEVLLDVFAHFRHDGRPWGHVAARICRHWHVLLRRVPQFWKTLLGYEFEGDWEPKWKVDRFAVALVRSAPLDVALCLPVVHKTTVDMLAPHARRFSSMKIQATGYDAERGPLDRLLGLDMPALRELEVYKWSMHVGKARLISFSTLPHLRTFRLKYIHFIPPAVPHTSLTHLELRDCVGYAAPDVGSPPCTYMETLLATARNCPNLETLSIMGRVPSTPLPEQRTNLPVHLPRLQHFIVQIPPEVTLAFLACFDIPLTTLVDLEPQFIYTHRNIPLPLSTSLLMPGHADGPPPIAEVAMQVRLDNGSKTIATWEARGEPARVRPLRASASRFMRYSADILSHTKHFLGIFAAGTAVTSLTILGVRRSPSVYYWETLLVGLPNLVRLAVEGGDVRNRPAILGLLGTRHEDGGCLCPGLASLSVFWDYRDDPKGWAASTKVAVAEEGQHGVAASENVEEASHCGPYGRKRAHAYCRVLEECLRSRAEHGCCALKGLSVSIWDPSKKRDLRDASYGAASVEWILREGLGDLAEAISVGLQSKWEI